MKVGYWDVDDDGLMSLDGRTTFPVYNSDGKLTTQIARYYWVDGDMEERLITKLADWKTARAEAEKRPDQEIAELERLYTL